MFELVHVTWIFGDASMTTQLAEIGYSLSMERIEPFS